MHGAVLAETTCIVTNAPSQYLASKDKLPLIGWVTHRHAAVGSDVRLSRGIYNIGDAHAEADRYSDVPCTIPKLDAHGKLSAVADWLVRRGQGCSRQRLGRDCC